MEHRILLMVMSFCLLTASRKANCNNQGEFLQDLVTTFHLRNPTIVIGGDEALPDLCFRNLRVLCLQYFYQEEDTASLAEHMELLQQRRYQDAVIFIGGSAISRLVERLSQTVPSLFRSPCPVFMSIEHESVILLRLDSNIIFFEGNEYLYTLTDRYAVKGGIQMSQMLGSWRKQSGMRLIESSHRWSRRRDLQGAAIVNTLAYYRNWAEPVYDGKGSLVGSQALIPDRLYAVAESLNLTIDTKLTPDGQFGKLLENGSWTGCVGMVVRDEADVCTIGLAWTVARE